MKQEIVREIKTHQDSVEDKQYAHQEQFKPVIRAKEQVKNTNKSRGIKRMFCDQL